MTKKDSVSSVIRDLIKKDSSPRAILNKNVRFSVTLTALQNKRLELLAGKVDTTKQDLISKILEAAMLEMEDQLGLLGSNRSSTDLLGLTTYHYNAKYVAEIVEGLGISEDEWFEIVENDWHRN